MDTVVHRLTNQPACGAILAGQTRRDAVPTPFFRTGDLLAKTLSPSYLEGRQISDNRRQTRIGYFNPSEESQEQLVGFRVDRLVTGGQGSR
jgi:hypothetical protein